MDHPLQDLSVSVTRAFRPDGTSYPTYWEVRNSARGEQLMDGVRAREGEWSGNFVFVMDAEEPISKQNVMDQLMLIGVSTTDAARITWWLVENGLVQQG